MKIDRQSLDHGHYAAFAATIDVLVSVASRQSAIGGKVRRCNMHSWYHHPCM